VINWTAALLVRPDVVKISLESEKAWLLREAAANGEVAGPADARLAGLPPGQGRQAGPALADRTQQNPIVTA
jgi:hypothetical protein